MKISSVTQIELTQEEILEAITNFVQDQTGMTGDTKILTLSREGALIELDIKTSTETSTENGSDKPKRTRRTKAEMEAARAAEEAAAAKSQTPTANHSDEAADGEKETLWTEEPTVQPGVEQAAEQLRAPVEDTPKAASNVSQIFPDIKSSAPVSPKIEEPPVNPVKSLFANLKQPSN